MILQEQWDAVIQAISSGLKKKDAIEIAGISEATFYAKQKETSKRTYLRLGVLI